MKQNIMKGIAGPTVDRDQAQEAASLRRRLTVKALFPFPPQADRDLPKLAFLSLLEFSWVIFPSTV